jgi:hypothetical protein
LSSEGQTFWQWLALNTARIQAQDRNDFQGMADEIAAAFHHSYPDLFWEIDHLSQPWVFCVSADGDRGLFPAVIQAVRGAPTLPGWNVQAFRRRGSLTVAIRMSGHKLGYEDIWCSVAPQGKGVDIVLHIDGLGTPSNHVLEQAAFVLLDNAVGEYDAVMKIANLRCEPLLANSVRRVDYFPLSELPLYLDRADHERSMH